MADIFNKPMIRNVFKGDVLGTLAFSTVNVLVNRLLDAFAFTQKLNLTQIDMLTVTTLEKFGYESLEDVILFFKMARTGEFGATRKSLDANLLFGDWLVQYFDLKAQEREVFRNRQKGEYMKNAEGVYASIKKRQAKEEFEKKAQDKIDYINKITTNFDRQMLEDLITDWSKKPLFKNMLKLLKQKRREILWIKKDHPLYQQKRAKELEHLADVMKSNEEHKRLFKE